MAGWSTSEPFIDVTENKRAHEVLQRTTTYLLQAQALTKTGCGAIGRDRRLLYWSAEMYRMYGFDPEAGLPSLEQVIARVHPVDRVPVEERDIRAARDPVEADAEFRIVLPDGTVKIIHLFCSFSAASGEPRAPRFAVEPRQRVAEQQLTHRPQSAAISSIAEKMGRTAATLRKMGAAGRVRRSRPAWADDKRG